MRWRNMWQCEAQLLYEANRRALETRDMVTFFCQFVSSPIVWFLAVKQNLSESKLNLLLLWSRSRRILKEGREKGLLPQSRIGRIMNRKFYPAFPVNFRHNWMKIRTTDRSYKNWSILVTTEWKYAQLICHIYNNWSILVTTEWKYAQLICHIYNNWSILVKREWKYVLMIDHIKTGRF